jgi:enoyl-CoA hydratase/carnithine racemase
MQKKAYESMDYMARTNSAMLTTKDMAEAVGAFMQKRKP